MTFRADTSADALRQSIHRKSQGRWLQRIADRIFGYDFFISYSHDDGKRYPTLLAAELASRKYRVFLDESEYLAGQDLRIQTPKLVGKSRFLLLVVGPNALESNWVRQEVAACLKFGRTPIVIDLDRTFASLSEEHPLKKLVGGEARIYVSEAAPRQVPAARRAGHLTRR